MKKLAQKLAAVLLIAGLCVPSTFAAREEEHMVQVGLAHSSGALAAAHLENNTGYGEGYRFGFYDEDLEFMELGYTDEDVTKLTMLRASQIYKVGGNYYTEKPSGDYTAMGCFHVVLDDDFDTYEDALEASEDYDGSFVAWIDGEYQLRQGMYETKEEAQAACEELDGLTVKGTSAYAVNVVRTGSAQLLFQFDGGEDTPLGIMPDVTGEDDVRTWFKGFRYRGGFRYERIKGGDMTVVNIVDMETYTKGVIPYEMNNKWPMAALEAQAICARSYAYNCIQQKSHAGSHFDICTTQCCQVYYGVGSNKENYQANDRTDEAVENTAGEYALYKGKPIWAYYSSSHGGASEQIDLVWNSDFSKFPYLCGVVDPYEEEVAHLNSYSYWMKTWTKDDLTARLRDRGYAKSTRVDSLDLTYSPRGNVISVRVNYENGKYNTFTPKMSWGVMSLFGLSSLHFTINGQQPDLGGGTTSKVTEVTVNEDQILDLEDKLYVINGKGKTTSVDTEDLYVLTGNGKANPLAPKDSSNSSKGENVVVSVTGSRFVVEGAGNGHQLGMSQYGAYAMAEEGFSGQEIVEFYYPGVEVDGL